MVRANKRLPSSVSVSKSALDSVTSALQSLPEKPKENWSLREAVSVLQETISAALSKGYSYDEVAKMLSGKGVDISASSLKSYLSAAKRQKGTTAVSQSTGRRTKKVPTGDTSMNGVATALNALKSVASSIAGNGAASDSKKTTRRKTSTPDAEPVKPTAKAKTAAKAKPAAKTKAASKTTARKKSS